MNALAQQFEQALLASDRIKSDELLGKALTQHSSSEVIEQLIVPTLVKIGKAWELGEIALSQIYMSGRLCEQMVDELMPAGIQVAELQPRLAIAVLNDYHFLGKKIVYSMLRASGLELVDYGHKTVEDLLTSVQQDNIDILLISVLMLPSALKIKAFREQLGQYKLKLIVGGAPFIFDRQLWHEVGADAVGYNAADAVTLVHKMIGEIT